MDISNYLSASHMNPKLEQTMLTTYANDYSVLNSTSMGMNSHHQMQLRNANRRWVISFSNNLLARDSEGHRLIDIAEKLVKLQVNVILICFNLDPRERQMAEDFVEHIEQLQADKIITVQAFLLEDKTPSEIEEFMIKRVANYNIPKNAPLIIEKFI